MAESVPSDESLKLGSPEEEYEEADSNFGMEVLTPLTLTSSAEAKKSNARAKSRTSSGASSSYWNARLSETREEKFSRFARKLGPTPGRMSCLDNLRRSHSQPELIESLEELQQTRETNVPKWKTMEDIILSRSSYPSLVTEKELVHDKIRKYEITPQMRHEWRELSEMENQRFSFYDELFAKGCVVDSLEVPSRLDDVTNLIEGDVTTKEKIDYARMVFKSKTVFTGNMDNGHFSGPGRYIWLDGTIYQGDFLNGLMHGEGVLLLPNGSFFEGEFANGERTGWGIYTTPTGLMYAGEWLKGVPNGRGKVWYNPVVDDGDYYDGQWMNGAIHGFGTRQYSNGDRYVGNFQAGVRSGIGTMIWLNDRQVYKGEWAEGEPNGFGEQIWYISRSATCPYAERNVYKGDFANGMRHGIGRQVYACGSIYDGRWYENVKHGKGIYVNPAGEILFAIFRHGSISGGADVPLHVPTYACKFRPLVTVLQQRLHTTDTNLAKIEEAYLSETVSRFLTRIRSLYKRAGYLGEWWGNQGHYPEWMKKAQPARRQLQQRHIIKDPIMQSIEEQIYEGVTDSTSEEPWIHGRKPHYGAPDHVNPVTRFGLWLLLKDCPGVLSDITLAELDLIWSTVPSISFQTRHHPFEPVQLWQFLQCLIVVASMLYIEIPKRTYQYEANNNENEDEFINEEDYTPKIVVQEAEEEVVEEEALQPLSPVVPESPQQEDVRRPSAGTEMTTSSKGSARTTKTTKTTKTTRKKRKSKGDLKGLSARASPSSKSKKIEEATAETQTEGRYNIPKSASEAQTDKSLEEGPIRDFLFSEAFELFLTDFLIPCLERGPGINLPDAPDPLPSISDLYAAFNVVSPIKDVMSARDFLLSTLHPRDVPEQDCIYWTRSRNLVTPDVDMSEYFTRFRESLKEAATQEDDMLDYDFLSDRLSNPEIFADEIKTEFYGTEPPEEGGRRGSIKIFGSGNKVFGDKVSLAQSQHNSGEFPPTILTDSDMDIVNLPLGEEDLTPVPFLWATDPVCTEVMRNAKALENIGISDALRILRQFYPRTCDRSNVINLEFNLTFGDWLFLTIIISKLSTDRSFCAWMKAESKLEHKRGQCQLTKEDLSRTASVVSMKEDHKRPSTYIVLP